MSKRTSKPAPPAAKVADVEAAAPFISPADFADVVNAVKGVCTTCGNPVAPGETCIVDGTVSPS